MNPALRRLLLRDTLVAGGASVGVLAWVGYGPLLLVPIAVGTVLMLVGGGAAGDATAVGAEGIDAGGGEAGGISEETLAVGSGADSAVRPRARLVFYGAGLLLWSLVAIAVLYA